MKQYRNQGAIGALLDEYEKAIEELIDVIKNVSSVDLVKIVDPDTDDVDCRSIQTILAHVVSSGYSYAVSIYNHQGESLDYKEKVIKNDTITYQDDLKTMFAFTENIFQSYPSLNLEELENKNKIIVRWGQTYDVDQLMEHAIVHILRHRRQIERFLLRIEKK